MSKHQLQRSPIRFKGRADPSHIYLNSDISRLALQPGCLLLPLMVTRFNPPFRSEIPPQWRGAFTAVAGGGPNRATASLVFTISGQSRAFTALRQHAWTGRPGAVLHRPSTLAAQLVHAKGFLPQKAISLIRPVLMLLA